MEGKALEEYLYGGIFTAVSLLIGEFWKDAIQETVYTIIPEEQAKRRIWVAYAIAIGFTVISFVLLYFFYKRVVK